MHKMNREIKYMHEAKLDAGLQQKMHLNVEVRL